MESVLYVKVRINWVSPRGARLLGRQYERDVRRWLWKGRSISVLLSWTVFFSSFILFKDLPFSCHALRTESQNMSVEPRRKDECNVSRASRVLSSTLRGNTSRAASAQAVLVLY